VEEGAGGAIAAPLPGKVVQVLVAKGDKVDKGKPLLVLEAMKMEHTIAAAGAGVVDAVHVAAGDQVAEGAALIALKEAEG
jgi:3-methylcrotonyl-CoA carboxylase alpha subunit